jgi:HAD superfamily hydrolase (TIGR01509 family)
MIDTVIFDLSEVLIAGLKGVEKPLASLLNIPEDTILEALRDDPFGEALRGRLSEEDYLDCLIKTHHWDISKENLKGIIRQNFRRVVPGMIELVTALKGKARLVLLSDHVREWVETIRTMYGFFEAFDAVYFSFELGSTKKEPETFERVLRELHKSAAECLFIDDGAENVRVATSLGISSIQFISTEQVAEQINQFTETV